MAKRDIHDRLAGQNREFVPLDEAARQLGIAPSTARKQVSRGRFPLPTHHITGSSRHFVRVQDVIDFTEGFAGIKRRPGRPRKVAPLPPEESTANQRFVSALRRSATVQATQAKKTEAEVEELYRKVRQRIPS